MLGWLLIIHVIFAGNLLFEASKLSDNTSRKIVRVNGERVGTRENASVEIILLKLKELL